MGIAIAMLTGSDYTLGIRGVGGITAFELLHEFHQEKAVDTVANIREWWDENCVNQTNAAKQATSLKRRLLSLEIPKFFNSGKVWNAYLKPEVDLSDEAFEWGIPDVDED